jgi:acyl carrier protein
METTIHDLTTKIRLILKEHGRLDADASSLPENDDLYGAGMTSHASVNVMLAWESEFDVEFPDQMLKRGTFDSVASIRGAVASLLASS